MNLWIITVNFGNTSATESLIDSLSNLDYSKSIKVGFADNSSTISTSNKLENIAQKTELDIEIFRFKKNYFYWPAAKRVIKSFKKTYKSYPDWIMVCNNDITFPEKNFINKLAELDFNKFPIIGPNIVDSSGIKLNPFMISPLSKMHQFYWK